MASHPLMTVEELTAFLNSEFPEAFYEGAGLTIEAVWPLGARVRQDFRPSFTRPGGTISGPTMMALVDTAMYVALLGAIGPVPLAVTTSLNINFLRKPEPRALIAECVLIKLGQRLAVGEVGLRSQGMDGLVAHATSTYSIPARPKF